MGVFSFAIICCMSAYGLSEGPNVPCIIHLTRHIAHLHNLVSRHGTKLLPTYALARAGNNLDED